MPPAATAASTGHRDTETALWRHHGPALFTDALPDERFELLEDAGHLPWLDHPQSVADSVRAILKDES